MESCGCCLHCNWNSMCSILHPIPLHLQSKFSETELKIYSKNNIFYSFIFFDFLWHILFACKLDIKIEFELHPDIWDIPWFENAKTKGSFGRKIDLIRIILFINLATG